MSESLQKPKYLKPWVIDRENFQVLKAVAGKHNLNAAIVEEKEGACFPIGSAETEIQPGMVGVHITGDREVLPEEDMQIGFEYREGRERK